MKNITVIGAGTMGNGIAHTFAQKNFNVNLVDISDESLKRAIDTISKNLDRMVKKEKITEKTIKKHLYTNNIPDPDILIRTGGHKRLSNFMLWQLAYAELYFVDKLWPDFNDKDLKKIIKNYNLTKRNFGSI